MAIRPGVYHLTVYRTAYPDGLLEGRFRASVSPWEYRLWTSMSALDSPRDRRLDRSDCDLDLLHDHRRLLSPVRSAGARLDIRLSFRRAMATRLPIGASSDSRAWNGSFLLSSPGSCTAGRSSDRDIGEHDDRRPGPAPSGHALATGRVQAGTGVQRKHKPSLCLPEGRRSRSATSAPSRALRLARTGDQDCHRGTSRWRTTGRGGSRRKTRMIPSGPRQKPDVGGKSRTDFGENRRERPVLAGRLSIETGDPFCPAQGISVSRPACQAGRR